jgi:hypothetical protein
MQMARRTLSNRADRPRVVVGKLVGGVVFVDQCGEMNGFVILVTNTLAFGVLEARRQASGSLQKPFQRGIAV